MTKKPKKLTSVKVPSIRFRAYAQKLIVVEILSKFWSVNFGFPAVSFRTFWFRKVREVCRIHFHLVAPPETAVVPSYDQKTEEVSEY